MLSRLLAAGVIQGRTLLIAATLFALPGILSAGDTTGGNKLKWRPTRPTQTVADSNSAQDHDGLEPAQIEQADRDQVEQAEATAERDNRDLAAEQEAQVVALGTRRTPRTLTKSRTSGPAGHGDFVFRDSAVRTAAATSEPRQKSQVIRTQLQVDPLKYPFEDPAPRNTQPRQAPSAFDEPLQSNEAPRLPAARQPTPADGSFPGNDLRRAAPRGTQSDDPFGSPTERGSPLERELTIPSAESKDLDPLNPQADCDRLLKIIHADKLGRKTGRQIVDLRPINDDQVEILPHECTLGGSRRELDDGRDWAQTTYTWKASGLCHKPLYFEQNAMERYGHSYGPLLDPIISGAHFFGTVPILPYKMGVETPCECVYTLGHYRPGNCAPYMIEPFPISPRGALFQAGAVGGLVGALP